MPDDDGQLGGDLAWVAEAIRRGTERRRVLREAAPRRPAEPIPDEPTELLAAEGRVILAQIERYLVDRGVPAERRRRFLAILLAKLDDVPMRTLATELGISRSTLYGELERLPETLRDFFER